MGSGLAGDRSDLAGGARAGPARCPPLDAGMVVLTGGTTAPIDLERGLEIELSAPQLGSFSPPCT